MRLTRTVEIGMSYFSNDSLDLVYCNESPISKTALTTKYHARLKLLTIKVINEEIIIGYEL